MIAQWKSTLPWIGHFHQHQWFTLQTCQPFNKIAIDLITDLTVSMSENQHILTIIDHLT